MSTLVLKRYRNRKLYDTGARRFTSVRAVAERVREGAEVVVIDHETGADITAGVLARPYFDGELADLRRQVESLAATVAALVRVVEHDAAAADG